METTLSTSVMKTCSVNVSYLSIGKLASSVWWDTAYQLRFDNGPVVLNISLLDGVTSFKFGL